MYITGLNITMYGGQQFSGQERQYVYKGCEITMSTSPNSLNAGDTFWQNVTFVSGVANKQPPIPSLPGNIRDLMITLAIVFGVTAGVSLVGFVGVFCATRMRSGGL